MIRYLTRHVRFYGPALVGVVVWLTTPRLDEAVRLLLAGDVFFAGHLAVMARLASPARHGTFRERASRGDEGLILIALITLAAVALSLGSVFTLLNHGEAPTHFRMVLSLASVPLSWFMLHTVSAFHYAHAYYGDRDGAGCGLAFPGGGEPQAWDFLYYAFVVGMTAQVSDVSVLTTPMRRLTLAQSVVSFFFNAVILAVAVNVTVVLTS